MADESELRLLITAQIEQAKKQLKEIGRDVDKMAAEMDLSGQLSSEALDNVKHSAEELKVVLDTMRDVTRIKVDAQTAEAEAKLEAFKEYLKTIPPDKRVRVDFTRMTVGEPAANSAAGGAGVGAAILPALIGTGIAALPALLAPAITATMGLAGAFTAASAGVIGFAAVAKSNLSPVITATSALQKAQEAYATATTKAQRTSALQAETKAMYGLDAAQRQAVKSLNQFENWWHSFAQSFQTPVLQDFSKALKMVETLMTDMRPVIQAGANALGKLMDSMNHGLNSSGMKSFFKWLAAEAGPAIQTFGTVAGNVFKGFASLLIAFTPAMKSIDGGLVSMTANFAKWAASLKGTKGFEEFLQYASKSGSAVISLIKNLASLVMTLLKYMAPLAVVVIQFVSDLAKFINRLLTTNATIRLLVEIVFTAVKNILLFIGGVIKVIEWLSKAHPVLMDIVTAIAAWRIAQMALNWALRANPIGLVITVIGLLIAGIVELVTHWKQVIHWIEGVWYWFTHLSTKTQELIAIMFPFIGIPAMIIAHWGRIRSFFSTFGADIEKSFKHLISLAFSWGSNFMKMFRDGIMSGVHAVENSVSHVAQKMKNFLGFHSPTKEGPGSEADVWAPNFIKMYTQGLVQGTPKVQAALKRILEPTATGVTGGVNSSAETLGASVASSIAQGESQASHGPIHMEVHFHGVNLSDPQQIKKAAQHLAIYMQQKRLAVGGTG